MKTLLWIDDDEKLIDATIHLFRNNGFHVLKATTPSQALRILRHQKEELDGVLLDVQLGGGENGLELLEELGHIHPDIKVVIFTAYPNYMDQVDAKVAGALAYFDKVDKSIPLASEGQAAFFGALYRIFPDHRLVEEKNRSSSPAIFKADISLWVRGLFFLLAFAIVIAGISVLLRTVSAWTFPVVMLGAILLYSIICAFLLRTHPDYGLSEKGFLSLMSESLSITPELLRGRSRGNDEETKVYSRSNKTGRMK